MTRVLLGLGSNLGPRRETLNQALRCLAALPGARLERCSPIYETPALLPPEGPSDWDQPFLNLAAELLFEGSPQELLQGIHQIEKDQGRVRGQKWSPRCLDIDILYFGTQVLHSSDLQVPHPQIDRRAFVLGPLKDLDPLRFLPKFRAHPQAQPLMMGILNLSPDSFSQSGEAEDPHHFQKCLELWSEKNIPYIDVGAESTRPRAPELTHEEEWSRLEGFLLYWKERFAARLLRPKLSLDTRHVRTAHKALGWGVDLINDVSGLSDEMMAFLTDSSVDYVLTFSAGVPAHRRFADKAMMGREGMMKFFDQKLGELSQRGVDLGRVILDPGLGFAKNADESLEILCHLRDLMDYPCRVLVGHSRKSFLSRICLEKTAAARDAESVGLSMHLARSLPVDILRVHEPVLHKNAIFSFDYFEGRHAQG